MTQTDTPTATDTNGKRRPTYEAVKVDDLPADVVLPRTGPRTSPAFIAALDAAQNDPGSFYEVAVFYSDNGAKNLYKRIVKGEVKLPTGGDWELEVRRMWAPNSGPDAAKPERWSKLYAKFLG